MNDFLNIFKDLLAPNMVINKVWAGKRLPFLFDVAINLWKLYSHIHSTNLRKCLLSLHHFANGQRCDSGFKTHIIWSGTPLPNCVSIMCFNESHATRPISKYLINMKYVP